MEREAETADVLIVCVVLHVLFRPRGALCFLTLAVSICCLGVVAPGLLRRLLVIFVRPGVVARERVLEAARLGRNDGSAGSLF